MEKLKKLSPWIVVSVFLFSLSATLFYRYVAYEEVYVPKRHLRAHEPIQRKDLHKVKVPKVFMDKDFLRKEEDFKGKVVALEHTLYRNQPVSKHAVTSKQGAEFLLKENEVAFSLPVNLRKNLGNSLKVGHRVDVYVQPYRDGLSERIAEGVRVISLRNRRGEEVKEGDFADVIILAVSKDYVSMFLDAESEGELVLSLNPDIHQETKYQGGNHAR